MGMCNSSNPRILQQFYADPRECICRACPSNWTSDGGSPSDTACRPIVVPQYFLFEFEVSTRNVSLPHFRLTPGIDHSPLRLGQKLVDLIRQKVSAKHQTLDIKPHGPLMRRNIGGTTSIFSAILSFNDVWKEKRREVTVLDTINHNCADLSMLAGCQQCQQATGIDLCSIAEGNNINLHGMALQYLDVPPENLRPVSVSAKEFHRVEEEM